MTSDIEAGISLEASRDRAPSVLAIAVSALLSSCGSENCDELTSCRTWDRWELLVGIL